MSDEEDEHSGLLHQHGAASSSADDDRENRSKIEDVGTNTFAWTLMLIFKTYIGAGILGLPYAFAQGKFIVANVATVLCSVLSLYCIWLLLEAHAALPGNVTSLEDIVQASFGGRRTRIGRATFYFVQFIIAFTQTGFSIAYVIFVGQSIGSFAPHIDWRWFAFMFLPLFYALLLMKQFKSLGALVSFAFLSILAALVAVLAFCFAVHVDSFKANLNRAFLTQFEPANIPVCLGLIVYVFEGIGLVVPLRKAMKEPARFRSAVSIAYVFLTILFAVFPSLCYLALTDVSSGGVIADLPTTGAWGGLSIALKIVLSVALWITYPVQMWPVLEICENHLFTRFTPDLETKRNYVRFVSAVFTVLIAVLVPHFSLFMALIGNLGSAMLMFVIPTACHVRVLHKSTSYIRLAFHALIMLFGIAIAIIGTIMSIDALATTST
jgi:proton-coupled amino acid transporter